MEFNEYQTPLTEELLESIKPEIREEVLAALSSCEYIRRLVSIDRKKAKDLERDDKGKIVVDICNPHILEDMEYFRPVGNYYAEHGCITHLKPNANPNSEFGKFISGELDRIWNGMVRESDGEWVTGEYYFYLNYSPIIQNVTRPGTKIADRVSAFPKIWEGTYLWYHYLEQARIGGKYDDYVGGKHAVQIAKRGAGKSYSSASLLARLFICGDNAVSCRKVKCYANSYQKEYLTKDGILNKFVDIIDFCAEATQFPSKRLKNSLGEMQWKMGYLDLNTGTEKGVLNEVLGIAIKDDPDKPRGKRGRLIIFEEFGAFNKFIKAWDTCIDSVMEGSVAFGQLLAVGTGGTEGSDFSGALELIYSPRGYYVYPLPNIFDKNSVGVQDTVFFWGAYLNRAGCYNKDGVSDVTKALLEICTNRYTVKYNSTEPTKLTRTKAEQPIYLSEANMKVDSTIYPIVDITERINQIQSTANFFANSWVGKFDIKNGNVEFTPSIDKPIRIFPHKDNKLVGAVEILEMPQKDENGLVYYDRYIAGIDPYDDDVSQTLSLGSLFIMDSWTDKLVLEYTGRPPFANDFYELCRRALIFYNARCNYEQNKKGLFTYFSTMNSLYLLTDTLEFLRDKELIKMPTYGNKSKGTLATASIKAYARRCIRDWLLQPHVITTVNENLLKENGEEKSATVPFLFTIKYLALLQEISHYNLDGNFDRHDALAMLMLLREEANRVKGGNKGSREDLQTDPTYPGNAQFFKSFEERKKK